MNRMMHDSGAVWTLSLYSMGGHEGTEYLRGFQYVLVARSRSRFGTVATECRMGLKDKRVAEEHFRRYRDEMRRMELSEEDARFAKGAWGMAGATAREAGHGGELDA